MSKTCQKIYIAGKISGDNDYRAKFNQAKNKLKKLGYIVLNPAELPEGMKPADYMDICFSIARHLAFLRRPAEEVFVFESEEEHAKE